MVAAVNSGRAFSHASSIGLSNKDVASLPAGRAGKQHILSYFLSREPKAAKKFSHILSSFAVKPFKVEYM